MTTLTRLGNLADRIEKPAADRGQRTVAVRTHTRRPPTKNRKPAPIKAALDAAHRNLIRSMFAVDLVTGQSQWSPEEIAAKAWEKPAADSGLASCLRCGNAMLAFGSGDDYCPACKEQVKSDKAAIAHEGQKKGQQWCTACRDPWPCSVKSHRDKTASAVPQKVIDAVKACHHDGGYGHVLYKPDDGGHAIYVAGDWYGEEEIEPSLAKLRAAGIAKVTEEAEIGHFAGWHRIAPDGTVKFKPALPKTSFDKLAFTAFGIDFDKANLSKLWGGLKQRVTDPYKSPLLGAGIGGLAGAGLGAFTGSESVDPKTGKKRKPNRLARALIGGLAGAGVGAAGGALYDNLNLADAAGKLASDTAMGRLAKTARFFEKAAGGSRATVEGLGKTLGHDAGAVAGHTIANAGRAVTHDLGQSASHNVLNLAGHQRSTLEGLANTARIGEQQIGHAPQGVLGHTTLPPVARPGTTHVPPVSGGIGTSTHVPPPVGSTHIPPVSGGTHIPPVGGGGGPHVSPGPVPTPRPAPVTPQPRLWQARPMTTIGGGVVGAMQGDKDTTPGQRMVNALMWAGAAHAGHNVLGMPGIARHFTRPVASSLGGAVTGYTMGGGNIMQDIGESYFAPDPLHPDKTRGFMGGTAEMLKRIYGSPGGAIGGAAGLGHGYAPLRHKLWGAGKDVGAWGGNTLKDQGQFLGRRFVGGVQGAMAGEATGITGDIAMDRYGPQEWSVDPRTLETSRHGTYGGTRGGQIGAWTGFGMGFLAPNQTKNTLRSLQHSATSAVPLLNLHNVADLGKATAGAGEYSGRPFLDRILGGSTKFNNGPSMASVAGRVGTVAGLSVGIPATVDLVGGIGNKVSTGMEYRKTVDKMRAQSSSNPEQAAQWLMASDTMGSSWKAAKAKGPEATAAFLAQVGKMEIQGAPTPQQIAEMDARVQREQANLMGKAIATSPTMTAAVQAKAKEAVGQEFAAAGIDPAKLPNYMQAIAKLRQTNPELLAQIEKGDFSSLDALGGGGMGAVFGGLSGVLDKVIGVTGMDPTKMTLPTKLFMVMGALGLVGGMLGGSGTFSMLGGLALGYGLLSGLGMLPQLGTLTKGKGPTAPGETADPLKGIDMTKVKPLGGLTELARVAPAAVTPIMQAMTQAGVDPAKIEILDLGDGRLVPQPVGDINADAVSNANWQKYQQLEKQPEFQQLWQKQTTAYRQMLATASTATPTTRPTTRPVR